MQSTCAVFYCIPWNVTLHYNFSTLSHKGHDFRKKNAIAHIKCVFWFSVQYLSETFLVLRKIQQHTTANSSCKVPVILVIFKRSLNFHDRCSEHTQISNFMKIRPVEAEGFDVDGSTEGRTDGQT
jgi:hypothetical protein